MVGILVFVIATLGAGASAAEPELPNLVPLPAYDVQIGPADDWSLYEPRLALRFTTAVANRSPYAFDLAGVLRPGSNTFLAAEALQCVAWVQEVYATAGACRERQSVGTIIYHDDHQHYHLERFENYELRRLGADGTPIMSVDGLVGESKKVSFCILNSERDSDESPPGSPQQNVATYSGCRTIASMGISPGFRDVYDYTLYDQQLLIDGVPDGTYAVVITVNPDGRFFESALDDNVSFTRVVIDGEQAWAV